MNARERGSTASRRMRCAARVSWFAAVPPREARAFPPAARPPVFRRARSRAVVCQLAPRPRRELPARVGSFVGRKLRVSRALGSGGRCCAVACHVSGAGAAGSMLRSPAHHGMVGLPPPPHARLSLFDSCHRKIRLIGGGPVAFLGGLVAKARRKEREGDSAGDPKLYLQEALLERKLPDLDMRQLVDLPQGLDYNEWLASHTLALFEHVNLVYGAVSEFCSAGTCPDMLGPGGRAYPWYDEKGKKSRVAAPQYIDYVMTFTQKTVSDETIFPTKYANEFPSSFESIVRKIVRLLFHVVAHVYAAHFREVALLRLHSHLHLTFAHLTALHRRFGLIEHKETEVLRDLELALRLADESPAPAPAAPPAPPTPPPPESPARAAPAPIVTQPLAGAAAAGTA